MTTATRPPTSDRRPPEGLPELPKGWVWTKLGAVLADIEAGRSPKNQGRPARDGEFGVLKVSAVSWGEFLPEENKALLPGDVAEPELTVRAGDLLISRANTTELVGAVVYVERDYPNLMLADKTLRLVPVSDVSAKYLLYALRTSLARDFFAKSATGTSDSMRNISQEKIRETPIPLPPLAEQRRIVERVEALLAQARTAREALAPLPVLVRRLRQSVLAAAFSGRLSEREPGDEPAGELLERIRAERSLLGGRRGREEARALPEGLPELPEGWAWARLGELLREPLKNGHSAKAVPDGRHGLRTLTLTAVTSGEFTLANTKLTSADPERVKDLWLEPGDILIERANTPELVGTARLYRGKKSFAIFPDLLIRARTLPEVSAEYIEMVLHSEPARDYFRSSAQGTAGSMPKISQPTIERLLVPLAPLAEQRRIVARVEALLAQADVIEQAIAAVGQRIADVERAVLARAFRGELVEQEVVGEPADMVTTRPFVTLVDTLADIVHNHTTGIQALADYQKVATLMAHIQSQFEHFNDTIRLGRFDENATLREKRDIIRDKLKTNLPDVFKKHGETCPKFDFLDQGSYQMDTGTKPLDGDYDIDQGIYFFVSTTAYTDPVVLKERVFEALDDHTDRVELRRSCVTVFYNCNDEPVYHVDIAVYSDGTCNTDGKSKHAKGKRYSQPENRVWEVSDPQQLSDTIFGKFPDEQDRKQFRRIIRYWKRWKTVNFTSGGGSAPNGIGLTLLTYDDFHPTYSDRFANKHDDLQAMRKLVEIVLTRFTPASDEDGQPGERLIVKLPIEPWTDVLSRMTVKQMGVFKEKLGILKDALIYAEGVSDTIAACERLQLVFGEDFPVPEKQETASSHPRAVTSSGNSA